MFWKAEDLLSTTLRFLGLSEPSMFGSELDLCKNVVIFALYRQAIPISSVGGSEIIVNMIFERFRASGVSGGKGKVVGGEIYGARVADRWCRDRKFRSRHHLSATLAP